MESTPESPTRPVQRLSGETEQVVLDLRLGSALCMRLFVASGCFNMRWLYV